jgi:membrane-associated HD superfamily phosphohydrolase
MPKKRKFEQVSLEVVKKVVEEQIQQEQMTESDREIKKKELEQLEQLLVAGSRINGNGGKR